MFKPPVAAFNRWELISDTPRSASFTAAATMSCSISTSSGSTASGFDDDAVHGHVAVRNHLHHAAAGGGLERHVLDLLLGARKLGLHLLRLLHHGAHVTAAAGKTASFRHRRLLSVMVVSNKPHTCGELAVALFSHFFDAHAIAETGGQNGLQLFGRLLHRRLGRRRRASIHRSRSRGSRDGSRRRRRSWIRSRRGRRRGRDVTVVVRNHLVLVRRYVVVRHGLRARRGSRNRRSRLLRLLRALGRSRRRTRRRRRRGSRRRRRTRGRSRRRGNRAALRIREVQRLAARLVERDRHRFLHVGLLHRLEGERVLGRELDDQRVPCPRRTPPFVLRNSTP